MVEVIKIETSKSEITEKILRALPEWFGIESAILNYINDVKPLPFWKAVVENNSVGFLAIMEHFPKSAEIYVMGLLKEYHRQGVGKLMIESTEKYLKQNGFEYLQVKTLSDSHPDRNYAKTRKFYQSIGFQPLEEFKTLWGEANPALLMIKKL